MKKEISNDELVRLIKRTALAEVKSHYFSKQWTSYKELLTYFRESGWTRYELMREDLPGSDLEFETSACMIFLAGSLSWFETPDQDDIAALEKELCNDLPSIVVTKHGPYESEVLWNPTWKQLLKCVRESIRCNQDPDHCGMADMPKIEIFDDGGINGDIKWQLITFCMDS